MGLRFGASMVLQDVKASLKGRMRVSGLREIPSCILRAGLRPKALNPEPQADHAHALPVLGFGFGLRKSDKLTQNNKTLP